MKPRSREKTCGKCGQPFQCHGAAGESGCWCEKFPPLDPSLTAYKDCLCPKCLEAEIESRAKRTG